MKALTVRCPDCGAQLKAEKGLRECTYCGTSIMVDDGSRGVHGTTDAPQSSDAVRGKAQDEPKGPSASLVLIVSLFLLGATALGLALSSGGAANDSIAPKPTKRFQPAAPKVKAPTMEFEAHHPVIAAVDGDGIADILGYFEGPGDEFYVAALNGKDGSLLWRSDSVPGLIGGAEPRVIVGTDVVFAASSGGDLTAYSLRDGGTLWTLRLTEVVSEIYELDGTTAQVVLTDKQVLHVGLERGALSAAPESPAELGAPLPRMSGWQHRGIVRTERFSGSRTFGDVDAKLLVIADDGSFQVSMGTRREGTPTPVLIRYEGEVTIMSRGTHNELWRTPVAGVDPLKARQSMGLGAYMHADNKIVCAAYYTVDKVGMTPTRFAAFDLKDGRRYWDQPIPGEANFISLTVIDSRIYVVTWDGLTVLDAKSGETLFGVSELPLD